MDRRRKCNTEFRIPPLISRIAGPAGGKRTLIAEFFCFFRISA